MLLALEHLQRTKHEEKPKAFKAEAVPLCTGLGRAVPQPRAGRSRPQQAVPQQAAAGRALAIRGPRVPPAAQPSARQKRQQETEEK